MSCGPAQGLIDLADKIDSTLDFADTALAGLEMKIASIPGFVEAQLSTAISQQIKLAKTTLQANLEGRIPGLGEEFSDLLSSAKSLAKTALFLNGLKEKYKDQDIDIDNIANLLREAGNDLNLICQLVPNMQTVGGEVVRLGQPLSFPTPTEAMRSLLKEGKFPDITTQFKDAIKDGELVFVPNQKSSNISFREEPGNPFRINGSRRRVGQSLDSLVDRIKNLKDNIDDIADEALDGILDDATNAILGDVDPNDSIAEILLPLDNTSG
tara:strand:- start:62552 stop:63355 length:804 start_codon:yes stop_codon:yes gene_type:complete